MLTITLKGCQGSISSAFKKIWSNSRELGFNTNINTKIRSRTSRKEVKAKISQMATKETRK